MNGPVSKTGVPLWGHRGFESRPLRQGRGLGCGLPSSRRLFISEFKGLAGEDLSRMVRVGHLEVEAPLAHVLHHLVEHAQHHAGQIIYAHKLLRAR